MTDQKTSPEQSRRVRVLVAKIAETGAVPLELGFGDDRLLSPWEQRAKTLESFYDPAKTW